MLTKCTDGVAMRVRDLELDEKVLHHVSVSSYYQYKTWS